MTQETPLQRVFSSLTANRCYACGWPLSKTDGTGCEPFNCSMRFKDDTQHLAEREKWHARALEMNEVLGAALSEIESPSEVTLVFTVEGVYVDTGVRDKNGFGTHALKVNNEQAKWLLALRSAKAPIGHAVTTNMYEAGLQYLNGRGTGWCVTDLYLAMDAERVRENTP